MIDLVIAPVWMASTAAVAFASFRISRALFPTERGWARPMHAIMLALATIIFVETVLGAVGFLHPWLLLFAVPAAQTLPLAIVRRTAECQQPLPHCFAPRLTRVRFGKG
ncbi:MAG TPA: hypothetical protein VG125_16605 [Pirellulales bacterium]|nr:hypothetical protein [Pirellulales bacterium]